MNENERNSKSANLDEVRFKLQSLADAWLNKLPELMNTKDASMTEKMLVNTISPFLPKFSASLQNKIDSMTDTELERILDKAERALIWLRG